MSTDASTILEALRALPREERMRLLDLAARELAEDDVEPAGDPNALLGMMAALPTLVLDRSMARANTGGFGFGGMSGVAGGEGGIERCAGEKSVAEPTPLDLVIMLDKSGSMEFETGNPSVTRSQAVTQALSGFSTMRRSPTSAWVSAAFPTSCRIRPRRAPLTPNVAPREAATEVAAGEEPPELPFDEERYALPLVGSGLIQEGHQVARQHLMQHLRLRAARLVDGRGWTPAEGRRRRRWGGAELHGDGLALPSRQWVCLLSLSGTWVA